MSNFKNIEKLGLKIWDYKDPHHHFAVDAKELEEILQSAQVVYGPDKRYWNDMKEAGDNYSAILIAITPLKKKTKAEAALEYVERMAELGSEEAEQILKTKNHG